MKRWLFYLVTILAAVLLGSARHRAYLSYVLRHKWFVLVEGMKLGAPMGSLLLHDLSKFSPDEWFPYARYFYSPDGKPWRCLDEKTGTAFDLAWLKHQKRNPHHWQYWVLPMDDGGERIFPMPQSVLMEMLADWKGAGRAQGKPDTRGWYLANRDKMHLHPETRAYIEMRLRVVPPTDAGQMLNVIKEALS